MSLTIRHVLARTRRAVRAGTASRRPSYHWLISSKGTDSAYCSSGIAVRNRPFQAAGRLSDQRQPGGLDS